MIDEIYSDRVYFSDLLQKRCPITFAGLTDVLDRYGVPYGFISGTKDIWCRDYMPVQIWENRFAQFGYEPDYLLDTDEHRVSITDSAVAGQCCGASNIADCRGIRIDGGNVVHGCGKVIMTSKVFEENPQLTAWHLTEYLTQMFGAEIIFLPWDTNEIYGHADGIARIIDDDTVLLTNYSEFDRRMGERFRRMLEPHFKRVRELQFKAARPHMYSWAYINWLQTDKVLVLPKFGIPEDEEAFRQIERLMPGYRGRIEMVDATDLVRFEGCLNCASWTVHDAPCRDLP